MYKQEVKHRLLTEIRNNIPYVKIGIMFNDYFTQDRYVLESCQKNKNEKHIPFLVYKNDKLLNECALINGNVDQFIENAFEKIVQVEMVCVRIGWVYATRCKNLNFQMR